MAEVPFINWLRNSKVIFVNSPDVLMQTDGMHWKTALADIKRIVNTLVQTN